MSDRSVLRSTAAGFVTISTTAARGAVTAIDALYDSTMMPLAVKAAREDLVAVLMRLDHASVLLSS